MNRYAVPRTDTVRRPFAAAMGYTSEVIGDKPARAGLQNLGVPGIFEPDSR
jgi:hypothetical protein